LSNKLDLDIKLIKEKIEYLNNNKLRDDLGEGIISSLYCPKDEEDIKKKDRVFYTKNNALIIDNIRRMIFDYKDDFIYLALLLSEASIHVNTSGVFKGFHKNPKTKIGQFGGGGEDALERIKKDISIPIPIFSNYECEVSVYREDINELVKKLPEMDVVYYDPPYNQHPYGSNYFMLNLIVNYKKPKDMSRVSGIPTKWNRSKYNKYGEAEEKMDNLIKNTNAKIILVSYNNEGIIPINSFKNILEKYGKVNIEQEGYTTFRGCRNIKNRSKKVIEQLFILEKR
jgi:adenine-specific DNA-methyltransferase